MRWLFLLRAFFPSWKFFDDVGADLWLEIRYGESSETLSHWQKAVPSIQRSLQNLIWNPEGNYLHATHNLLSHLNADIVQTDPEDADALERRASFRLTRNLAEMCARRSQGGEHGFMFQFRVLAESRTLSKEQVLLSPVYKG